MGEGRSTADLPTYSQAIAIVKNAVSGRGCTTQTESVSLDEADGRILRTPIIADRDQPPFDRSAMDGYAVRSADVDGAGDRTLDVVAEIAAGAPSPPPEVQSSWRDHGTAVKVATGATVPPGFDLVVPHERTNRENPVTLDATGLKPGFAIHVRGNDAASGDVVVPAGTVLGPQHAAIASTCGVGSVDVACRPRGVILTTGDELRPSHTATGDLLPHQIRNSNRTLLRSIAMRAGVEVIASVHVEDTLRATTDAIADASKRADIVISVGGISAGDRDFVLPALTSCGAEFVVQGAAIQPGKPVTMAMLPRHRDSKEVMWAAALPGNPVSALACFCLFVDPLIRLLTGAPIRQWQTIPAAGDIRMNPAREAFRPAMINDGHAVIPPWKGSGDMMHTAATNGLLAVPRATDADESPVISKGTLLSFLPWPA